MESERLYMRPWREEDAPTLYELAKEEEIGLWCGWKKHESESDSLSAIHTVLSSSTNYAICRKEDDAIVGCIVLKYPPDTDLTEEKDEAELGYWIGKPYWGVGYATEAAEAMIKHGFLDLGLSIIWCAHYDGNNRSKRVQEKLGFVFHHTCNEVPVPLLNEIRVGHVRYLRRSDWEKEYRPLRPHRPSCFNFLFDPSKR